MIDIVEQVYTHQRLHIRMISVFYTNKYATNIVTDQEAPIVTKTHWLHEEVSKVEVLLSSFDKCEDCIA